MKRNAGYRKEILAVIAALGLIVEGPHPVYAEELAEAVDQGASVVESVVDEAAISESTRPSQEELMQHRKERVQQWLENHPRLKEKMDFNGDGEISRREFQYARHLRRQNLRDRMQQDYDNNPPGYAGGPGTNWENPAGPVGGPGASPDRYGPYRRDNDSNPPGQLGGRGTNWENPAGPVGGPGASPDRYGPYRRDNDSNPPGQLGGRGTNWENPPGRMGGPGTSPDRRYGQQRQNHIVNAHSQFGRQGSQSSGYGRNFGGGRSARTTARNTGRSAGRYRNR